MRGVRGSKLDLMSSKIFKSAAYRQDVRNKRTVSSRYNRLVFSQALLLYEPVKSALLESSMQFGTNDEVLGYLYWTGKSGHVSLILAKYSKPQPAQHCFCRPPPPHETVYFPREENYPTCYFDGLPIELWILDLKVWIRLP